MKTDVAGCYETFKISTKLNGVTSHKHNNKPSSQESESAITSITSSEVV